MSLETVFLIATFTAPEKIGTDPYLMLWLLPLALAISTVYKAMKLPTIKTASFTKELAGLFGSIVVFIAISALVLYIIARLITE